MASSNAHADGWTPIKNRKPHFPLPNPTLLDFYFFLGLVATFIDEFQKLVAEEGYENAMYHMQYKCMVIMDQITERLITLHGYVPSSKRVLVIKKFIEEYKVFVHQKGACFEKLLKQFLECLDYNVDDPREDIINIEEFNPALDNQDAAKSRGTNKRANVVKVIMDREALERLNAVMGTNRRMGKSLKDIHKPHEPRVRNTKLGREKTRYAINDF